VSGLQWAAMAVCGGCGAVARFVVDEAVTRRVRGVFPWGILLVNLTGSLALGVLVGASVGSGMLFVAGVGLLGGFTTFSTWMVQTQELGDRGHTRLMLANWLGSMAVGLLAAAAGWALALAVR
jgi:fluoride exporter